jgi:hypothetical protein
MQNSNLQKMIEELEHNNRSLLRYLDSKTCRDAQSYADHVQNVLNNQTKARSVSQNSATLRSFVQSPTSTQQEEMIELPLSKLYGGN